MEEQLSKAQLEADCKLLEYIQKPAEKTFVEWMHLTELEEEARMAEYDKKVKQYQETFIKLRDQLRDGKGLSPRLGYDLDVTYLGKLAILVGRYGRGSDWELFKDWAKYSVPNCELYH
jgi:hypothetical protein